MINHHRAGQLVKLPKEIKMFIAIHKNRYTSLYVRNFLGKRVFAQNLIGEYDPDRTLTMREDEIEDVGNIFITKDINFLNHEKELLEYTVPVILGAAGARGGMMPAGGGSVTCGSHFDEIPEWKSTETAYSERNTFKNRLLERIRVQADELLKKSSKEKIIFNLRPEVLYMNHNLEINRYPGIIKKSDKYVLDTKNYFYIVLTNFLLRANAHFGHKAYLDEDKGYNEIYLRVKEAAKIKELKKILEVNQLL